MKRRCPGNSPDSGLSDADAARFPGLNLRRVRRPLASRPDAVLARFGYYAGCRSSSGSRLA